MMNEKNRENENEKRKESKERVETTEGMKEKKRKKQKNSNTENKVFCIQRFWDIIYYHKNKEVEVGESEYWSSSNKFKVLTSRVMNMDILSRRK